jgi:hypothetical protein
MIWMDVDTALAEVPVNYMPLIDDTDFKSRETSVVYNAAGMDLVWNFVTTSGSYTQTAVTPTTAGVYDWTNQGDGMYSIEIPASGGASINNDTEGFGWFTGVATGVLPWAGPVIGFRAAIVNDALIDGGDLLQVDLQQIGGDAQSATDLKDFADVGYDPSNNQVEGVKLTDTLTTYTGNTVQTGDAYAVVNNGTSGNIAIKALLDAIAGYVDTEVAAIKAKTDNLPTDPADESQIQAAIADLKTYVDTEVAAILSAVDTEVAAIKAKTDNLPASPAAVGSVMQIDMDQLRPVVGDIVEGSVAESLLGAATELGSETVVGLEYTKTEPGGTVAVVFDIDDAQDPGTRTRQ